MNKSKQHLVYQFKITLHEIEPKIWRRVLVPANYSFWDLHVAIQDVMGWLDYHLHAFRLRPKNKRVFIEIGIPDDETGEVCEVIPGWKIPIVDYFDEPGQVAEYEYDFGDSWRHEILFEGILLKTEGVKYPVCQDGDRSCPPEDCGGVSGYYRLLEILQDSTHEKHNEFVAWLKGHAQNYYPYTPEAFNLDNVRFDNPTKRWEDAFAD